MSTLFSRPRVPRVITQPLPSSQDTAVQEAKAEASQRRKRARGFRSTVLTQQLLEPPSTGLNRTLGA